MLGLRQLLLVAAVALFVISVFADDPTNWWAWGLAAMAGGLVVEELGFNQRWGTRRTM
jgi:hypothetical protein